MLKKFGVFVVLLVLTTGAFAARADERQQTELAGMSDEELASYITGRLKPLLKDEGYEVRQSCDATGCSVVVQ